MIFTVICPFGIRMPHDLIAALILPLDSLIDESQRPIISNVGIPGVSDISISDMVAIIPSTKHELSLTTFCLTAIKIYLLLQFGVRLASENNEFAPKFYEKSAIVFFRPVMNKNVQNVQNSVDNSKTAFRFLDFPLNPIMIESWHLSKEMLQTDYGQVSFVLKPVVTAF